MDILASESDVGQGKSRNVKRELRYSMYIPSLSPRTLSTPCTTRPPPHVNWSRAGLIELIDGIVFGGEDCAFEEKGVLRMFLLFTLEQRHLSSAFSRVFFRRRMASSKSMVFVGERPEPFPTFNSQVAKASLSGVRSKRIFSGEAERPPYASTT